MNIVSWIAVFTASIVLGAAIVKLAKTGFVNWIRELFRHDYPGEDFVAQNREIYTAITELRAIGEADRAYVIQFHNGHEFLLSNPVWKLTCTHEVVKPGVTYEANNIQGILVSRVSELVSPLIQGDFSEQGVSQGINCKDCPNAEKCRGRRKWLSIIRIDELTAGFTKFFLENQNIKMLVQCGMANKYGSFGVVGVDICGATETSEEKLKIICKNVCEASEKINFSLRTKSGIDKGKVKKLS